MNIKFSENVVPLTDLKTNPGRMVRHATEVQSVVDFEAAEKERAFMRVVVEGLADLEAGREVSLSEARARLGLN